MSALDLMIETGLLATWTRQSQTGKSSLGAMLVTDTAIASDIPCAMQTIREEDLEIAGIPTDVSGIKYLLFLPYEYLGSFVDIRNGDRITMNRQANSKMYYNVIHVADAVVRQNHHEIIIREQYQD